MRHKPFGDLHLKTAIIIPAYNSSRFIDQTIASIVAQSCPDWELVVVDDGSKDNTGEIVARYAAKDPRIRLVQQPNGGIAAARNRGYAESNPHSPFVVFFDHDDLWKSDALSTLTESLEANPDSPAAYGISRFIDDENKPHLPGWLEAWHRDRKYVEGGQLLTLPITSPTTFAAEIYENRISTMGQVLIRRSALESIAPVFDPKMVPCDDWDLYLRLSQIGDLIFIPELILDRRIHGNNVSNNESVMSQSEDNIRSVYASLNTLSERNKNLARKSYRMWLKRVLQTRLNWAKDCFKERKYIDSAKQLRHAVRFYLRSIRPL